MNTERNLDLLSRVNHDGARPAADSRFAVLAQGVSRLRSSSPNALSPVALGQFGQVASFRAGLRLSLRQSVALTFAARMAVQRRVAGQSVSVGRHSRSHFLSFPLPNKLLVPTAQTQARLGLRAASGAAAAQRNRYARPEHAVLIEI